MSAASGRARRDRYLSRDKAERLQKIADQVAAGVLTIRQATPAERERYGIRAPTVEAPSDVKAGR